MVTIYRSKPVLSHPSDVNHDGCARSLSTVAIALAQTLTWEGHNASQILNAAGLSSGSTSRDASLVAAWRVDSAWAAAGKVCGDRLLAIRATENLHPGYWGILGYAIYSSETVGAAWSRYARYASIIGQAYAVEIRQEEQHIIFSYKPCGAATSPERALSLAVFALKICRDLYKPLFSPSYVRLGRFLPPLSETEKERARAYFGSSTTFEENEFAVAITTAVAEAYLPAGNNSLAQQLEAMAQSHYGDAFVVRPRLEAMLREMLPDNPTVEVIARSLGMCARTLQRHLLAEGCTYRDVIDDLKRIVALECLANPQIPIKEIAYRVGVFDQSNFSRACRKWFGKTPARCRMDLRVRKNGGLI